MTILVNIAFFEIKWPDLALYQTLALTPVRLEVVGMRDMLKGTSKQFRFTIAKQLAESRRHFQPATFQVRMGQHDKSALLGSCQTFLALPQRILGPFSFYFSSCASGKNFQYRLGASFIIDRFVVNDAEIANELPRGIEQRGSHVTDRIEIAKRAACGKPLLHPLRAAKELSLAQYLTARSIGYVILIVFFQPFTDPGCKGPQSRVLLVRDFGDGRAMDIERCGHMMNICREDLPPDHTRTSHKVLQCLLGLLTFSDINVGSHPLVHVAVLR